MTPARKLTLILIVSVFVSTGLKAQLDGGVSEVIYPDDFIDIHNTLSLDEFSIVIENFGTSTMPTGLNLPIAFSFGPDTTTTTMLLDTALAPGQTATIAITDDQVYPALPLICAVFELCATLELVGDSNDLNNSACDPIEIGGDFSPGVCNYPIGIQEEETTLADVYYAGNALHVQLEVDTRTELLVTNMNGQTVFKKSTNSSADAQYDLRSLPPGTYIVSLYQENRSIHRKKIAIY